MHPLLFDVGLPHQAAEALTLVGWTAHAVGYGTAPARDSEDEENCEWCKANGDAILVTTDRGKKDPTIFNHLGNYRVHAIFVHDDLRLANTHELVRAILDCEGQLDKLLAGGRHLIRHRLKVSGRLEKR